MQEDNLSDITLTPRIPSAEENPFIPMAQKMAQPDQLGLNAPTDNPFLAIAKGMGGEGQPPAIGSIASTLSINPDQAAQASKLGGQFGLGQDIALRNMDELRRRSLITRLQQTGMLEKNPALAESLANPAFSAQAHDDIDNLAETGSWIDSISKGFEGGFLMQEMGELRFSPLSGERFYGATPAQQERMEQVRKRMQETQGSGILYMTAQVIAQQLAQAKGIGTAALTGFGIGAATGGAPGAVAGGGVGAATGVVLTTAQMEAGLLYDELEQAGVDPETATTAAVIGGTINGAIELLGAKVAAAPFRPLIRKLIADRVEALAMPTMRSAAKGFAKGYATQVGTETLEETVQEITAMATSEIAKAADGIDSETTWSDALTRITDAAIGGFQGSLLLGGIGPGANAIVDTRRAKQTEAQQKWLDGLQERVAESKVRERNPNAFQEFVEKQVEGKPVATIYVDAEEAKGVLAQLNLTVSQVNAIVPGFAEQVRAESERGGDVTIPTALFSARLANTDLGNALRPHMRLSPEALSVTQLEAVRAERERMSAAGQDVIDERMAAEDTAFVESAQRVEDTMYGELIAAGKPATEAKINAEFFRNMMASLADRVRVTPEQMFELYRLRVRGEGQVAQAAPAASAPAVSPRPNYSANAKLFGWNAQWGLATAAKQQGVNLANLTRAEYVQFAIDNGFRINDDQLRMATMLRTATSMSEYQSMRKSMRASASQTKQQADALFAMFAHQIKKDAAASKQLANGIRIRSGTASSDTWLYFKINSGANATGDTYKAYAGFSDPYTALTPDKLKQFMELLQARGFNGDLKSIQDLDQGSALSDQIVMHGATKADAELAQQLAQEFFGAELSFSETGMDSSKQSYSQILAAKIDADISSRMTQPVSVSQAASAANIMEQALEQAVTPAPESGVFDVNNPPTAKPGIRDISQGPAIVALMDYDGTVYYDVNATMHGDLIDTFPEIADTVIDGGFIIDGKYVMNASDGGYAAEESGDERMAEVRRFTKEVNKRTRPLAQASRIDADYMAAVERGDMDTAQRMVDEAAQATGIMFRGHKRGRPQGVTETFVSQSREQAQQFANQHADGIVSLVRFTRPIRVYEQPIPWQEYQDSWRNSVLLKGYDAVRIIEPNDQDISLAIRNPSVIEFESADPVTYDESGNVVPLSRRFDITSPRIFEQAARLEQRPVTPGFYSALEREVGAIDAKALTADGWNQRLQGLVNNGVVKQDEIEWSGLKDWIAMQDGKVSKDTVLEFLRGNGVRVERTYLGRDNIMDFRNAELRAQMEYDDALEAERAAQAMDEPTWTAADAALTAARQRLVAANMARQDAEQRSPAKYYEYTLPGGENYREVLLTLPVSTPDIVVSNNLSAPGEREFYELSFSGVSGGTNLNASVIEQSDGSWQAKFQGDFTRRDTKESAMSWAQAQMRRTAPQVKTLSGFRSTHWTQQNVVVHLRLIDRVDADGKRVLFVEEVQSDWGQAGVKRGFVNQRAADMAELNNLFAQQEANPTDARKKQIARVRDRIYKNEYNVSRAPYVETTEGWLNLGLKQIMLEAVTGNYDRVAFVNGEQSADRYDLSKRVSLVSVNKQADGRYLTYMEGIDGTALIRNRDGFSNAGQKMMTAEELEATFGKEVAKQAIEGKPNKEGWVDVRGDNLRVGGEGMKSFYDNIVPAAMNKLLKKYGGGKLGAVVLPNMQQQELEADAERMGMTVSDVLDVAEESEYAQSQPGFDITPAMVEKLATGLPLFQAARGLARGGFDPQKLLTTLNKDADFSTFAHETAHYFLTILGDVAARPDAPASVVDDMNTLLRWFGVKDLATWNAMSLDQQRQYHEQFAYSFETYLFEGKAPSVEMQGLFDQFARWLKQVYQGLITKINDVYKAEFGKDLPILTGEVRQVMDRMLATEDQISRAQAIREMKPQFQTQEQSGMDDATWAAYQELQEQATERAVAELTTATLKEMAWMSRARGRKLRELQRQHDDKRKEIKDEVTEDLRILPVYRAMEFLKRGKVVDVDGTTKPATGQFKLSLAGVQAVMPPGFDVATLGRGRYGMVNEDGLHPDLIAPLYGYASGAELVTALSTAKPFADAVAERTDQRMLSEFSELADPAARSLAVDRAIHNEARARLIAVEQRWAAKLQQPVSVIMEAASQVAGEVIGRQTIRTLSPRAYAAAEARAARLATSAYTEPQTPEQAGQTAATRAYNAAIAAGKTVDEATAESLSAGVAAVEKARERRAEFDKKYGGKSPAEVMMRAKRQQLLQNMLARQALEARAEIDRARSAFKRFFGSDEKIGKTRNMEMVSAARAILGWYGFGKRDKSPAEYVDQLKAYNPAAYAQLEPLILRATKGPQDYRDLTVDEFRVLRDTVDGLWIQARKDKQVKLADRTMALDEVVGELDKRLEEIGVPKVVPGEKRAPTFRDRAARHLMTLRSTMRRVESWADSMDGVSTVRPFTNYLVRPVLDAVDKFTASRNKYMKRFRDLVVNLQMPEGTISAPELDYTFGAGNAGIGKAELLGALLHTGNESNYRKLLLGRGWGQEDEFGNLDDTQFKAFVKRMQDEGILTKSDYDFLQAVWDLNEDIKPIAQKAHYELYGFYFTEIPASEVVTPFGTYRGGYVPAATDKFMVADAAQRAGEEELESNWRNSLPSTGRGFTKTRMAGYNEALSLDVRVIGAHIDAALRFSMIQPAITQALRILRSREFAARLDRVDPTVKQELLIPWLNRTARQLVSQPGKYKAVDTFWRGVRNRTGMSIMFANLRNAMQQFTGLFPAGVKVKPRYLTSALTEYVGSPQRTANSVAALSPFMEDRLKGQSFEVQEQINEVLLNPSRFDRAQAWTDRHGYFLQQAFQNMVDVVTWVGAYNQSLSTTDTTVTAEEAQREAIAAGDAAVRLTQGSVRPSDVSAFESGTPFFRTLTQFAGYFNMLANLNATEYVKVIRDMGFRGNKGKLVYIYMMGFMLPAVVADAIVRSLGGGWEDEDEDGYLDTFMDWFFGSQIRQGVAFVPFGTTAYTLATTAFDDKPYNDRMTTSPSVASLEAATVGVGKAAIAVVDEEKDVTGKNVRDVLTLLSLATGIPFSVLGRPAGYLVDVQRGEVEPTSTYDMIRGTITGTATPESKR